MSAPATTSNRGGRQTSYKGKIRDKPVSVCLTPEAHLMLATLGATLQRSKSDVAEQAIRELHARTIGGPQ